MEPIRNTREDVRPDAIGLPINREVTVEDLLAQIARMASHAPHEPCPEGGGPLAPVAAALKQLASQWPQVPAHDWNVFGPRVLLPQAQSFMVACDTEARIRFSNRIHPGLKAEDVLGSSVYQWLTPESVDRTRTQVEKVLSTGETATFEGQTTHAADSMWYTGEVAPIRVEGQIIGFTLVVNDITELKKTQQRLERSNKELESFASIASHDMQEPLRKIQTFGERLKLTCAATLSPEGRNYIERMQQAATRMRGLIDDLLHFARVSSKNRPFTPVDLTTITREVLGDLETQLEKTGASVTVGALPVLDADPTQMRQLIQNLLGNALKFRREGIAPLLGVHATVDPCHQRCELVVEDNGIGFDEKYSERIFEVFQRLHGRNQYEGTGIGLAICRKIAERHGGRITARSTPGQGSTFSITLPLKQTASM